MRKLHESSYGDNLLRPDIELVQDLGPVLGGLSLPMDRRELHDDVLQY